MPRKKAPPRLWLRERNDGSDVWLILDGGKQISTGCAADDHEGAQERLTRYINEKWATVKGSRRASDLTCGRALAIYAQQHGPEIKAKATLAYSIEALASFWTELTVADIKRETCQRYRKERKKSDGTVRRELGVLQAAVKFCATEGYLIEAPRVWLPPAPPPRDRCLSQDEADALLVTAADTPHVHRFIWLGLHTGTRSRAMLNLQWTPNFTGGHIDLDAGLLYRRSTAQRETKKRQTPARLPDAMIATIAPWREQCRQFVIEWRGQPVQSVKHAFARVCERAGVDNVTPHILRHTAITNAMMNGADPIEATSFFGITYQELERTYLHHHPDHQKSVGEALLKRANVAGSLDTGRSISSIRRDAK